MLGAIYIVNVSSLAVFLSYKLSINIQARELYLWQISGKEE
jgi:hypothetical protein